MVTSNPEKLFFKNKCLDSIINEVEPKLFELEFYRSKDYFNGINIMNLEYKFRYNKDKNNHIGYYELIIFPFSNENKYHVTLNKHTNSNFHISQDVFSIVNLEEIVPNIEKTLNYGLQFG